MLLCRRCALPTWSAWCSVSPTCSGKSWVVSGPLWRNGGNSAALTQWAQHDVIKTHKADRVCLRIDGTKVLSFGTSSFCLFIDFFFLIRFNLDGQSKRHSVIAVSSGIRTDRHEVPGVDWAWRARWPFVSYWMNLLNTVWDAVNCVPFYGMGCLWSAPMSLKQLCQHLSKGSHYWLS